MSGSRTDVAMKGGGYYSLATVGAKYVIEAATPLVVDAIGRIPDDPQRPFVITDMGCADGGTSLTMISAGLETLRARDREREVQVLYTDQPRNDFNALFAIVHGLTDFRPYLHDFDRVYVSASATSFYHQILPAGQLDLGFSATAMHWLSSKPGNISNHVHMVGAGGDELALFALQGRRDWETILLHRAAELAPGGRLVLVNFARDEQGRYLGNTGGINMFDTFNAIWVEFLQAGRITRDEYVNMTLPQYYNNVDEFSAPLIDKASRVHEAGLRLEHIETRVVACPFAEDFKQHGDAARFASEYIPTLRSWTEATFYGALDAERAESERRELIDAYYAEYQNRVQTAPEGHGMDYVHAYIVISKEV